jgi:hypothetical protein
MIVRFEHPELENGFIDLSRNPFFEGGAHAADGIVPGSLRQVRPGSLSI